MFPRLAVKRSSAFAARRVAVCRPACVPIRFQSTSSESSSTSSSSAFNAGHFAAGVAGGLTVTLIGYIWYRNSGLRNVVQTTKEMKKNFQSARDNVLSKANESLKNPRDALPKLRSIAKSYTFFIPGGDKLVDDTFDELADLYETHVDEMDMILKETTEDLIRATKSRRADPETAKNVYDIIGNSILKMKDLGKKVGSNILDKNPMVKEKLGSSYEQLMNVAQKAGPEGKMALKEATDRVRELVSRGQADDGSIKKVRDFIEAKASRLRTRVGESEILEALFRNAPERKRLLSKKAPHAQELVNLARVRSDDAKNLVKETVSDVVSVLEEKGKKAKELSERRKADGEK